MANFNTHISVAFVASGVTGLVIYKAGMLTAPEFLWCVMTGTIGGLLPDIDLDHSVPAKVGFNVAALLSAFIMVIVFASYLSLVELGVTWGLTYFTVRYGVFNLFIQLTVHRGIVHSVPYLAIMAMGLVYASFYWLKHGAVFSWFLGAFLLFGALVHLVLDEAYSVNVLGLSVKKSFGTALKFFRVQQLWWYVGLYVILLLMIIFAPPFKLFWQTLNDPISWLILKKNFLPTGMRLPNI